jgi:hypothetical protein
VKYAIAFLVGLCVLVLGCHGEGTTVTESQPEQPVVLCDQKDNACDAGADADVDISCSPEAVIAACEDCKANGCPQADPLDEPCHYSGVIHYTDMLGCLQTDGPQANCPACAGITFGMPITEDCATCAAPFTPCSLSCAFEASGGK